MLRSFKDKVKVTQVYNPQTISASANSTGVKNADFGSTSFIVNVGAMAFDGSNKLDLILQHSDVDVDGSYAACADADIYNAENGASGIAKSLDSTADQNTSHFIHYRGNKLFTRVRMVETGTVSAPISVTALQGYEAELQPPL